jgi:transposase-like protein
MDKAAATPKTLLEAVNYFAIYENCHTYMVDLRWPDGQVKCPRCGSDDVAWLPNAKVFKCYCKHDCQKFSLKVGTIFEESPIALEKWLPVMWMLVNAKNGISSWEIHRAVGVTQKTAWFMLQRCRLALQDEGHGGKLGGEVEVDETYIGGKARNMHADRKKRMLGGKGGGAVGKTAIQGLLQRHGKVSVKAVGEAKRKVLVDNVKAAVEPGSNVFTDDAVAYYGMLSEYDHQVINHAELCGR